MGVEELVEFFWGCAKGRFTFGLIVVWVEVKDREQISSSTNALAFVPLNGYGVPVKDWVP